MGERIGLFGGTFNPVHLGHLIVAEAACESLGLDRLLFMPAYRPPHKLRHDEIAPAECRLAMLHLAIAGNERFGVTTVELDRNEVSYTVETLVELDRRHPGCRFTLLLGGDSIRDFATWREPERIAQLADIAVVPRPGVEMPREALPGRRYALVESPMIEISSSDIRRRHRAGQSIRYRIPDSILAYIEEHGLYRS